MKSYSPRDIEPKWQKVWADTKLYAAQDGDPTRPKYYMLTEFPYPSGEGLHAGHTREYTLGDVMARHQRMLGRNVLYPMGWDAFGLPAENYAIKNKVHPSAAVAKNVATFKSQMQALGLGFDWDREINTIDPNYYRWTQWLFLQFLKHGLAYQDEIAINWCPKEKTGLANEEVVDGKHERCGTPVEKKLLKQWLLRITKYADRLIDGLKTVDYPPRIADQQINWIGRKHGINITYGVANANHQADIICFTTRPDTNFGATFIVIAPEHPLAQKLSTGEITPTDGQSHATAIHAYIKKAVAKSEVERQEEGRKKTGVFTGLYIENLLNGRRLPVYVADFVLGHYGTGAVVGVPGHDLRDFEFAQAFGLPVERVVVGPDGDSSPITSVEQIQDKAGTMINSDFLDGLDVHAATQKISQYMEEKGFGKRVQVYKLRDWIFSRQHYWGEPIPVIHCPKDGAVPVPDDQLPVKLPEVEAYEPTDTGESPLAAITDWVNVKCPQCGGPAKRETDTMPNWAGSSWYWLRYMDPHNDRAFADPAKLSYWGEVDLYLGGMEHTTLHLLYSRFWHQFLYDQKLVPTPEPYAARRGQGIVLAADGRKMSKSLGNVINPTDIIARYGADAFRLYIMFMAPYDETTPWSDERLNGVSRFLYRTWGLAQELMANRTPATGESEIGSGTLAAAVDRMTHKTLKKVHDDLGGMRFNTMVSALMEFVNFLNDAKVKSELVKAENAALAHRAVRALILMLAPAAPHITEELWRQLGEEGSVHVAAWPAYDPQAIKDDIVTVVVQVNGKVRGQLAVAPDISEAELINRASTESAAAGYLDGQTIARTVVVPRKLINFVVK